MEKLVADRELKLELTEAAKMRLVDIGYEPAFGARPLKRAIVKAVQDPLAEELLAGGYTERQHGALSTSKAKASSS